MKKNNKYIIAILISLVPISYVGGALFPINYIFPIIQNNQNSITEYEFWTLCINISLSLSTFLTIVVALFKDEIKRIWKNVKLDIKNTDNSFFRENLSEDNESPTAESYNVCLTISNNGTIEARNINLIINSITHENKQSNLRNSIKFKHKNFDLNHADSQILPSRSYFHVDIVRISPENKQSTSNGVKNKVIPKFYIGQNEIPVEYHNGVIELEISVFCDGLCPIYKKILIKWDGQWTNRLSDICPKHLSAEFQIS